MKLTLKPHFKLRSKVRVIPLTYFPATDQEISNRVKSGRWIKYEKD